MNIQRIVIAVSAVALTLALGGAVPAGAAAAKVPTSPVIYTGRGYAAEPSMIDFEIKYNGLTWDGYVTVKDPTDGGWSVWNPDRGYATGPYLNVINDDASKSNTGSITPGGTGNITLGGPKTVAGVTYFTKMQLTVDLPSPGFFPPVILTITMNCGYDHHPAGCNSDGAAKGQATE